MMDTANRLEKCFRAVFPAVDPAQIASADSSTVEGWDSLAHITLLTVINEEFGVDVDFEEFEGATSFAAILERVERLAARA